MEQLYREGYYVIKIPVAPEPSSFRLYVESVCTAPFFQYTRDLVHII